MFAGYTSSKSVWIKLAVGYIILAGTESVGATASAADLKKLHISLVTCAHQGPEADLDWHGLTL